LGLTEIIAFVTSESELKSNKLWLDRVHERMTNMLENDINEVDLKYLSRYNMTKTCQNSVKSWFEWIEPLTIHSRHPFSFISAIIQGHKREDLSRTLPTYATSQKDVFSVDHILVQSGPSFHHRHTSHRRFSTFIIDAGNTTIPTTDSNLNLVGSIYRMFRRIRHIDRMANLRICSTW
jgi:hypothetical protein